ncbi:hypothetical protein N6H18_15760 [Reichenbachiella agarivorans]|uniref:Uncharacterized protein n=1 Tax=Reichenbachiella agarivorans TaxID=2979464 RepID=A0ABY6CMR1_9BACT|nr:hypothetical protein [Reichenbachiella agarivorans]UXP31803.1 hypothetical protein N6H18_15760 [Reichenbachiella agarivorans]
MNKQKFIDLVGVTEKISEADVKALETLVRQYPYFQNGHAILAKASRTLKLPSYKAKMNTAAVYATDRLVFKDFITATPSPATKTAQTNPTPIQKTVAPQPSVTPRGEMDKLIEEIYANLENWKSSREQYLEYEKEHPEEIVILPVPKADDAFEKLKKQVADEVNAEESKPEPAPLPENKAVESAAPKETKTESVEEEKVVSSITETEITSEIEVEIQEVETIETTVTTPEDEIAEIPIEEKVITPKSSKKSEGPEIESLDDHLEALEAQIDEITPILQAKREEEINADEDSHVEPVKKETTTSEVKPQKIIEKPADDKSDTPVVDESVIELDPETVYSFNSPIPEPQELPESLQQKRDYKKEKEAQKAEEDKMISSEELSKIVDKVSEEVEMEDREGHPEDVSDEMSEIIESKLQSLQKPKDSKPEEAKEEPVAKVESTNVLDQTPDHTESPTAEDLPKKKPTAVAEKGEIPVFDTDDEDIEIRQDTEVSAKDSEHELGEIDEERKSLKLVPGASKGDKKFRLSVLKRPHKFTKPKKETKETDTPTAAKAKKEVTEEKVDKAKVDKKTAAKTTKEKAVKKTVSKAKSISKKESATDTKKEDTPSETAKENEQESSPSKKLKSTPKFRMSASIKTSKKLNTDKTKNEDQDDDIKKKHLN